MKISKDEVNCNIARIYITEEERSGFHKAEYNLKLYTKIRRTGH